MYQFQNCCAFLDWPDRWQRPGKAGSATRGDPAARCSAGSPARRTRRASWIARNNVERDPPCDDDPALPVIDRTSQTTEKSTAAIFQ
jgi:hypothetical protein